MLVVLAGAAEMERNLIRERTRSALAVKRANGQRTGTIPYGFNLADDGRGLIANDAEQAVIEEIKTCHYTQGWTLEVIAEELNELGVPTKTGRSRRWTHQVVGKIRKRCSSA